MSSVCGLYTSCWNPMVAVGYLSIDDVQGNQQLHLVFLFTLPVNITNQMTSSYCSSVDWFLLISLNVNLRPRLWNLWSNKIFQRVAKYSEEKRECLDATYKAWEVPFPAILEGVLSTMFLVCYRPTNGGALTKLENGVTKQESVNTAHGSETWWCLHMVGLFQCETKRWVKMIDLIDWLIDSNFI